MAQKIICNDRSRVLSLTTMQWAYLSWRDSEIISEKWISHIQSSHTLQNFESEPDSCDVTLASKDGQILPTVDSLQLHLTFQLLLSWQQTFTARLPSSRGFYTENGTCTSTPAAPHLAACPGPVCQSSFTAFSCSILLQEHWRWQPHLLPLQHQHQHRPTSSMSEYWAQLAISGLSCYHFLFVFFTRRQHKHSALSNSMFHHTAYWVAPLWSTCSPIVKYSCVLWRAGGSANRLPLLENPKGLLSRINHWLKEAFGNF